MKYSSAISWNFEGKKKKLAHHTVEKHFFKSFLWGIKSLGAKNIGGLRIIQEKVVYISPLIFSHILKAVQWLSVSNSLRPMDCSTAGFPVHHQLPEFTQTHLHWVGDAIWPSHRPLLLPSIFPSIRVFSSESVLPIRWPKFGVSASASVLLMNIQDWFLYNRLHRSPCSPRDSQESSPTPQFKSINSSVLSVLYGPTLTSIHDY